MKLAETTPAAGPDSTMNTGLLAACSAVSTPPFDCMTRSAASRPTRASPSSIPAR